MRLGSVIVATGDYVIADASGVAFIPVGSIDGVLEAAESIAAREALMTKTILAGQPAGVVMGSSHEELLARR